MDIRRWFQLITLIITITSLIIVCARYRYAILGSTKKVLYTPIAYLAHVSVFNAIVLLSQEAIDFDHLLLGGDIKFHAWSAGVTLHSIITVIFLIYAFVKNHA